MSSRRKVSIGALCAAWVCAAALLTSGLAGAGEPLRIGYPVWVGYGPLFLAQEKQFFAQNGVELKMINIEDTKLRYAALAAGRVDGLAASFPSVTLYTKPDLPLVTVLPLDESAGGDGVVAIAAVKSAADLKGRTVAFELGSISEFYLTYLLSQTGLGQQDIRAVNMRPGDAAAAFIAGRVDAAVTWEPWLTKAAKVPGGHVLHDSSQTPGLLVDVLVFRKDVVQTRRAEVEALIRGWLQAVDYYKANRTESIGIMAKKVGGWLEKPEDFAETLNGVRYYDRDMLRAYFTGPRAKAFETSQFAIDLWARQGKVDGALKPTDIVNNTLIPQ
jgi:NitT/TauT family transport system substrate-binding protein